MSGFGGTVKLTGESEYRKALKEITSNLKVLSSEMKVVTSSYDKNDKSVENLSSQNKVLNKQIEEQKEKVEVLKSALAKSTEELGENHSKTKQWQIQLNNAQAQLNSLNKKLDDNEKAMKESEDATEENTKEMKDFGEQTDKAGQKVLSLGDIIKANLISDAIKTGLKGLVSLTRSVATEMLNIGVSAVKGYAESEQLIGGIDTLFKTSSEKMQEYANNAYKTAGLNANEYMEITTSFSASLISSLKGDTEKATSYANMAIVDMADNANKMGSDLPTLQTAYAGFAKGQFMLLDNLKLGYGGTKTEMQRLLADAEKISGVKYDISSFADITQAIHVMQVEMGIAGATAKEADTTITGSINSMKSAGNNLLTGLANGNADVDKLVGNFVDSALTVVKNLKPVVSQVIKGSGVLITSLGTELINQLPYLSGTIKELLSSLGGFLIENAPILLQSGATLLNDLYNSLLSGDNIDTVVSTALGLVQNLADALLLNWPLILEFGLQMIVSLAQGITKSLPVLIPTLLSTIMMIVETLTNPEMLSQLLDAALILVLSLAEGLLSEESINSILDAVFLVIENLTMFLLDPENIKKIVEVALKLVVALANGLITFSDRLASKAKELIEKAIEAITSKFSKLKDKGREFVDNVKEGIMEKINQARTWGRDMLDNFIGGILDKWESLKNTVSNVAQSVKDFLGFSKPKKGPLSNFDTYAPDMIDLFIQGVRDSEHKLTDQISKTFNFGETTIGARLGFDTYGSGNTLPATNQSYSSEIHNHFSFGNVTITNGDDIESLAQKVSDAITRDIMQKGGAFA